MNICILVDDINSWFVKYARKLSDMLESFNSVKLVFKKDSIEKGDILFLLSCSKIIEKEYLMLNKHNIVVHASDLPSGKGFSPLQWQILEGCNRICLTLFEAIDDVDAGPYYFKEYLELLDTDLLDEMRAKMADKIISMCVEFVRNIDLYRPISQCGTGSFYRKLEDKDHRLDINKTIREQFNIMRISDNERFPMWFEVNGVRYYMKIYKDYSN